MSGRIYVVLILFFIYMIGFLVIYETFKNVYIKGILTFLIVLLPALYFDRKQVK